MFEHVPRERAGLDCTKGVGGSTYRRRYAKKSPKAEFVEEAGARDLWRKVNVCAKCSAEGFSARLCIVVEGWVWTLGFWRGLN